MCWKRLCSLVLLCSVGEAWGLSPQPVADNTWMVEGRAEEFTPENGGDISNVAFIVTGQGVLLIDSGSTLAYGQALKQAIARLTDQPVRWIINTHHHPDHTFGNGAFPEADILALPGTRDALRRDGPSFEATLRARLGEIFSGTRVREPGHLVAEGDITLGGYPLRLLALTGHSGADLVVLDNRTGVLFAGDILFWQRAPTTPHSPGLQQWLADLSRVAALAPAVIVPGHGPVARHTAPIEQTRAWLAWLDALLRDGIARGATENTLIQTPLPEPFRDLPLARHELTRSVTHFYQRYEDEAWRD